MTRRYRPWTPAEDQHLREHWFTPGMTLAQIGAAIDRSDDAVKDRGHAQLKLGQRAPVNSIWTAEFLAEVKRLYLEEGMQPKAIAERFGLTRNQVTSKLDRAGVLTRAAAKSPPSIEARPPITAPEPAPRAVCGEILEMPQARPKKAAPAIDIAKAPRPWETRLFGECAFPVAGRGADTLSCCNPTDGNRNNPYCEAHRLRMTAKPSTAEWSDAQRAAAAARARLMNALKATKRWAA